MISAFAFRALGRATAASIGAAMLLVAATLVAAPASAQSGNMQVAQAQQSVNIGQRPGSALPGPDEQALLRELKGYVSIPDAKAATLVQPQGRDWRATVKGPVRVWGSWFILGMVAILILFYLLRGTIRIDRGRSGRTIERFNAAERFVHWLTASAFVVLAITGLNITYGRYILLPLIGYDAFSGLSVAFKYAHNFLAFPFMIGLALMFVMWVIHNVPNRYDFQWLARGGGLFAKGVHPPARKFNAGQKLIFWAVVLGGTAISISGIYLLFPFEFGDVHTQQTAQLVHSVVSLLLTAVIIAHIYIGTLGMEGAWDAMGSGRVDENWAREHHSVWVAELKGEPLPKHGHD